MKFVQFSRPPISQQQQMKIKQANKKTPCIWNSKQKALIKSLYFVIW